MPHFINNRWYADVGPAVPFESEIDAELAERDIRQSNARDLVDVRYIECVRILSDEASDPSSLSVYQLKLDEPCTFEEFEQVEEFVRNYLGEEWIAGSTSYYESRYAITSEELKQLIGDKI